MLSLDEYTDMIKFIWQKAWLTNMGDLHNALEQKLKNYFSVNNLSLFVNGHMALEMVLQAFQLKGEACSPDGSRDIIDLWKKRYPEIIKPVYRDHNIGMQNNTNEVIFACQGEFMAWLEGDDFWTDKNKLQKQLKFLQSHREYIGVVHNTRVVDADEKPLLQHQEHYPIRKAQDFAWKDFEKGYMPGQAATFFFRNIFAEMNERERALFHSCHANGDSCIISVLLLRGKIRIMPDVMSAVLWLRVKATGILLLLEKLFFGLL